MRISLLSLKVWIANTIGSVGLVVLDAWRGPQPTPAEPVVPDMPRQRSTTLFVISDAERFALVRAKVALEMGIEPAPEVLRLIVAMHERASRLELEEHAEDFDLWDAEVGEQ